MPDLLLKNRPIVAAAVLMPMLALIPACGTSPSGTAGSTGAASAEGSGDDGCITDFDESKDYFPDKVEFEDATNISVEYKKSYKVVTVTQPSPGAAPESYVFVQCGAPEPSLEGELAKATKVSVPVKKVAAGSTTQVPAYELLDRMGVLVAVSSAEKLAEGPAKDAVDSGQIQSIKNANGEVNVEKLASLAPDVYVTSGTASAENAKIAELKIPVIADAEWLEKTALGRAEWTKFKAILLNREKQANEVYGKIKADYQSVATKAQGVTERPTVLLGAMSKGTWYASAADSYLANEIKDAGGEYVLKDVAGVGTKPLDLEVVLAKGAKAQYWIGATHSERWESLAEPIKDDPRLGKLTPVQNGDVWTFSKKLTPGGGNDYWQSGVVRPDLVLADLVAILHPELMPNHEFTYYEQVPKG
ncbi:ABC transporter substrate-binding protein [Gephyromycinifex aptenodytis]|uniref:ABC transporter substrate-binding protein n=1 Tax=Gephyromycinifex aptenodytis TaxID=2716227 RepID=UPI0014487C81|nr:ABC transporter substrate-binding protein [Gephyromycinifex aptenodytis]